MILTSQNLAIQLRRIFILEGKKATHHSKQNNPSTPNINHQRLVRILALDHLGSSVAGRPTSGPQPFFGFVGIRKSKVHDPDGPVVVDKAVLELEISMNDSKLVNVLDSAYDLLENLASFSLSHSLFADNVVKKFSTFHVLHYKKEVFGGFNDFVQLDDVWVANEFQNVNLAGHSLDICHIDDSILFEDLDCDFLTCWQMGG